MLILSICIIFQYVVSLSVLRPPKYSLPDSRRFHDTLSCEALSSLIPLTVALTSNLYSNAWQNIHKIRSHYRTKKAALCCSLHDLLIRNSPEIRRRSVRVFPRNYLVLAMLISKDHFPVIQQYLRGKKTLSSISGVNFVIKQTRVSGIIVLLTIWN